MVWNFTETGKIWGLKAWRFGLVFVVLDLVYVCGFHSSFRSALPLTFAYTVLCISSAAVIQISGAASASTTEAEAVSAVLRGTSRFFTVLLHYLGAMD
jgi:hypothetical protein